MTEKSKWSAECRRINRVDYIIVRIEKEQRLIERIKQFEGRRWDPKLKAWLLPDTPENRKSFQLPQEEILSIWHEKGLTQFSQWLINRRYSENTVKVYREALRTFLLFHNTIQTAQLSEAHLNEYNTRYIMARKLSSSWQNQAVNAIKLYAHAVGLGKLNAELVYRPKREKTLPNVLSKQEVKAILDTPLNFKHKAMLCLIYSCGLRRSELLNLKPIDISAERGVIVVRQSKGKKDRIVSLSPKVLDMLRDYYKAYKPRLWLFEGQKPGERYSATSLMKVFKRAVHSSGLKKPATLHWLRHSYATHLMESGTDLRLIQELLGHSSSRTTEIYTHVSTRHIQQIKSPFDDL